MNDQVLTALLPAAFLVVVLACLLGICLVTNYFFSEDVRKLQLIPNCEMYVSHPRVARVEIHTFTSLVSS